MKAHSAPTSAKDKASQPTSSREPRAPEIDLEGHLATVARLAHAPHAPHAPPEPTRAPPLPDALLVDQIATEHQSSKSAFLARLRSDLQHVVENELQGTGWTADQCPWLDYWFAYYDSCDAAHVEAALRRYAPEARLATSADEYIGPLSARVRVSVAHWRATGEIDAPAAAMPETINTLAALGPGTELASDVRSRMESALGTSLAGTRIHHDTGAARIANAQGARAFAIGSHVAFADHAYAPGNDAGDALLAHELAHTVQQRDATTLGTGSEASAENAADRHVVGAFARLKRGLSALVSPLGPTLRTGLRLARCRADTSEANVPALALDKITPGAIPEEHGDLDSAQHLPFVSTEGWKPPSDESLLFVVGTQIGATKPQLFIVPAKKYVLEAPGAATIPTAPPTTLAAFPGVAHASLQLVNAGGNVGAVIDVGGRRTAQGSTVPPVAVLTEVRALTADLSLQSYQVANLSHLHGDHLSWLLSIVEELKIEPGEVYVQPGLEKITNGAVGNTFDEFEQKKGTRPKPLKTVNVVGPTNKSVTRSTLRVGNMVIEMAVGTQELQKYVDEATTGDPKAASKLADAATPLQHVRWDNSNVEMVVVGDLRGRDIANLAAKMGEREFKTFIGNARVIVGLHHLGAIGDPTDVRGLQTLVSAMGGGAEAITVIAQIGPDHEINMELVKALQSMGIRVVAVGEESTQRKNIQLKDTGDAEHTGGQAWEPDAKVRAAQVRLEQLEHAIATLESLDDYRGAANKSGPMVLAELKAAATQLRDLLVQRGTLATQNIHLKADAKMPPVKLARIRDALEATRIALEVNLGRIEQVQPIEHELGEERLTKLAQPSRAIKELQKEREVAKTRGETSPRLQQLYAAIDPMLAKEIWLNETTGAPAYRGQIRDTWGRLEARLETQHETEKMMQPLNFTSGARAASYVGLALEAFELAAPGLEQWAKSRQERAHEDFYMFYRDLMWWEEKGLRPPILAQTTRGMIDNEGDLMKGFERRMFNDKPEPAHRDHDAHDKWEAESEKLGPFPQVDLLWVASLDKWPQSSRVAFLDSLRRWVSAHINSVEDYFAEMRTAIDAPIRLAAHSDPFAAGRWQIHVGVVQDGHVHSAWQDSEEVSTIMNAALKRARVRTEASIESWIARSPKPAPGTAGSDLPSPKRMGRAPGDGSGEMSPDESVRHESVVIKNGAKLYSYVMGRDPIYLGKTADRDNHFRLLELDRTAPAGYVWVAPGNAITYYQFRELVGWQYASKIKIPNEHRNLDPSDPNFDATAPSAEKYMSADEYFAWSHRDDEGFYFDNKDAGSVYRGTVYIYERRRMRAGQVLMKKSDLGPSNGGK